MSTSTTSPPSNLDSKTIAYLLSPHHDPSIRFQAHRDLLRSPPSTYLPIRALILTTGHGARLFAHQDPTTGLWAAGSFVPADFLSDEWTAVGQPWTATSFVLTELRLLGLDPASPEARRTLELVGRNCKWDEGGQDYWDGETEECINGRTVADGAYFGVTDKVEGILKRLVGEQMDDGGWNCERERGSKRGAFASTLNVLEGLIEFQRGVGEKGGSVGEEVVKARKCGEEYLLRRALVKRESTGKVVDQRFLQLMWPWRWRYDVLRVLEYFRTVGEVAGERPDGRLREAVEHESTMYYFTSSPHDTPPDTGPVETNRYYLIFVIFSLVLISLIQPSGRTLDSSIVDLVWLRASPLARLVDMGCFLSRIFT
ncbi:hypothetical protein B0T18DRAFT_445020 [Schizothecium vesticola]|uniref:Uncharacterized protein n=1 Tax=Schizothecium vesticola TaxID=314040 RepID=A0AA40K7R3_9PEZI|nr:hypothetical protein B0T18DRAFT_445020 [Schizothecium vesticola]